MSDDEELEQIREQKRKELIEREQGGSPTTGQTGSPAETPDSPIEIEGQDHLDDVTGQYDVVLVDCYADWCGPCQMMEPTIEAIAAESDAAVAKVDVDVHQGLAGQLGVQGVPTLVVFSDGQPVERVVGAQERASLERLVQQAS